MEKYDIPELLFTQHFRLDKSTFTQLCDELKVHTELKGSLEITLEVKICDYDLNIINVNSKFGGATHDSHIWSASHVQSYMRGVHESGERVWLLGDFGHPQRPWLMTPILNAEPGSQEELYTRRHVQARAYRALFWITQSSLEMYASG
ncbi:hypothetical protein ACJJTC_013560 [Scirpophaga incertulas]